MEKVLIYKGKACKKKREVLILCMPQLKLVTNKGMVTETKRKRTKICCLDLDVDCTEYLKSRFGVYEGSLGTKIDVSDNKNHSLKLLLNYDLPPNLQEYEIIVEDMLDDKIIPYADEDHIRTKITGKSAYYFESRYPQTVFNPRPCGSHILKENLKKQRRRPAIKIAFHAPITTVDYVAIDIANIHQINNYTYNNYEHLSDFCLAQSYGSEVKLCDNKMSRILFEPFLDDIEYYQLYNVPKDWNGNMEEPHPDFHPLLLSKDGSVISYIWFNDEDITIILPQTSKKVELLKKVFQEILEVFFSDYLPEVESSAWINKTQYFLPNESELHTEKEKLKNKYQKELAEIEKRLLENKTRYSFLHKLITATGDELVEACLKFFKWLGFETVIDKDKNLDKEFNEEDVQIKTTEKGLLVIEIKGINGTSTDSQCGQILKVVNRRREELRSFDVYGLYIVNNERGVEPLSRTVPPFNSQQIRDAEYDGRGLCYTWQLFNLFFEIEDGVITKEEAQVSFFNKGLLVFKPSLNEVGVPHKYYKHNEIVCIKVSNTKIRTGDYFIYNEKGRWKKVKIVSIKDDEDLVDSVSDGSFGFGLEHRVPSNIPLYI